MKSRIRGGGGDNEGSGVGIRDLGIHLVVMMRWPVSMSSEQATNEQNRISQTDPTPLAVIRNMAPRPGQSRRLSRGDPS